MNYLKQEQNYFDRNDLHIIRECLNYFKALVKGLEDNRNSETFKKYSPENFEAESWKIGCSFQ
jgi:hypothetical protein